MAILKRRKLLLSTGKEIGLYGTSIAISKNYEIGEGHIPNILARAPIASGKDSILNPYELSKDELAEIADYNIRLWVDFKDNLRLHGLVGNKLFAVYGSKADNDE